MATDDGESARQLGLPGTVRAVLFDMDGVLTDTASLHAAAWKEMFDEYLQTVADRTGEPFLAFDIGTDYPAYVDGRPRADGTRTFLKSRGIELPEGSPSDPPRLETVNGLGNRKNEIVQRRIREDGVTVYPGSVRYLEEARRAGLRTAVVSSSANTSEVLRVTGLERFIEARVDAAAAVAQHLAGKPAPDTFLAGAAALGVTPDQAAVFEDALAGVRAGSSGGFARVVGVDRVGHGHGEQLLASGADVVVTDLAELLEQA